MVWDKDGQRQGMMPGGMQAAGASIPINQWCILHISIFPQNLKIPPISAKFKKCSLDLRSIYFIGLTYVFGSSPYFDHDACTHYALGLYVLCIRVILTDESLHVKPIVWLIDWLIDVLDAPCRQDSFVTLPCTLICLYTVSQKKLCKIVYVRTLSNFHQL